MYRNTKKTSERQPAPLKTVWKKIDIKLWVFVRMKAHLSCSSASLYVVNHPEETERWRKIWLTWVTAILLIIFFDVAILMPSTFRVDPYGVIQKADGRNIYISWSAQGTFKRRGSCDEVLSVGLSACGRIYFWDALIMDEICSTPLGTVLIYDFVWLRLA